MEEEATLQPSVDTSSESSSVVKDIDSCSIDQSSPCDQDGIITSTSILCSGIVNEEKPTESTPEISTINSVTLNCVGNESNVILPEFPGTTSGFDSAESTNDADFLTTRKAVLSAIDLMDEGLRDEEETRIEEESRIDKSMNTKNEINRPISDDQCETIIDNELGTEKPKNCLVPGEMNNETSTATDNTNWSSSDLRDKKGDSKEKALSESNATDIEHDICKTSEIGETTSETLSETCKEKKDDDKNENIQPVNVNLIDLENVNDKTIGSKLEIDPSCHTHEDKNFAKLSVQNKSLDTGPVSKSSLDEEHHEKGEVSNSDNKNTDGDSKTEGHVSMVDISKETINKLEDSDDVIMLDEIDSEAKKSQDETALPVSVEIDDVEVSVFKYEKNKADKSQIKEEFKLDDMVLSSDEDSDDSQPCKDRLPILSNTSWDVFNHTPNILGIEETILTQSNTVKSENTKLSETIIEPLSSNKKLDTEVMDVEEGDIIQDNCKSKKEEEISNMDVEESIEGSVQKAMSSKPNESEGSQNASSNEDFHKGDEKMASQSDSRYCKNDNEAQLLESDPESENASKSTATEGKTSEVNETDLENMLREALNKNEKFREHLSLEPSDKDSKKPLGSSDKKDAEVICLVDDDEDDVSKKKKPAAAVNCVNPNCMSGEDLSSPPAMFVLSYFGLKRAKGQQVCAECFNMVVEHQEVLCSLLQEKKPLLSADFPSHKDVILLDSDEESLSDNESNLSDDTMSVIRDNLDDVISDTLAKFDFDFQLRESCNILNNRLTKLEEEAREITNRYDDVQKSLDNFRKKIYEEFQQETREKEEVHFMECEIPPMPIIKSKLQNQLYNRELMNRLRKSQQERESREEEGEEEEEEEEQQTVQPTRTIATKKVSQISQPQMLGESSIQDVTFVRSETKCEPPPSLPPPGPLLRPRLRVGDLAYTMKVSYFSIWVHCRILEIIPRNPTENDSSTETYRVRLENVKKNAVRTVTGKYLAYPTPARVQLKVGVRVIAIFREEEDSVTKDNYYVGVVAEPPKSTNRYRYLVFFDDGYTQYCPHENILVVCACSKNVWEDIHPEPRDFIKNYLQQYPERPMVKLSRGQIVKVEWNGRWWIVRVLEVDGSLVKVHFDADKRTEWIYRGSTRLGPMFQELAAAKERQHGSLLRSRGFGGAAHHKSDMPYVEYTRGDGDGDNENKPEEKEKTEEPPVEEQAPAPRSVARKSTNKRPPEPVISNTNYSKPLLNQLPEGRLRQRKLKPKHRPLVFRPHQCSEACVSWTGYTPASGNRYDPLVKPLMYGFERIISTFKGKMVVLYRAPCGRLIRTQQEMLRYLRSTRSQLTIDLFDFDFWVNPLNEFEEGRTFGKIEDLSYGKENVSISCVNELDHSMPQYVQYMTARQPAKDVHLNLDPEFLVGCDCTDDCEDRSKCSCWQLTLQGKAYQPDGDLDPLFGYQYRRLPERIATGIYECNSRCKCSNTCQNRVAQQPLSCRLQLFKTLKKGWGIRCLHDIPRGAFICIYAGFLLTEQEANEGGKTYGDEYLAELDYIESVENLKEGYESEAKEPSDLDEDEMSQKDTMDIEYENNEDSDAEAEQGYTRRPGDIRLRLRRRTADEVEKESRRSKADDDAISISDEELDSGHCGGCREPIENTKDSLRCQGCVKSFHFRCTPLKTSVNVDKLGSDKGSWVCPKCDALVRKPKTFDANITVNENEDAESKYPSVRELYGPDENVYIMDAKTHGNIGRYLNHSCSPNVFVQNVFVDTHDLRFPWVAFFASQYIPAGTELTWDYNYDVGSVPGKVMLCYCGSNHCRGRLL